LTSDDIAMVEPHDLIRLIRPPLSLRLSRGWVLVALAVVSPHDLITLIGLPLSLRHGRGWVLVGSGVDSLSALTDLISFVPCSRCGWKRILVSKAGSLSGDSVAALYIYWQAVNLVFVGGVR
jgi:hypothetical protein